MSEIADDHDGLRENPRGAESHEPKRFDATTLPEVEAAPEFDYDQRPALQRYREQSLSLAERRERKTRETLDRLVPVTAVKGVDVKVDDVAESVGGGLVLVERRDPYTGPMFRTGAKCSLCGGALVLESLEEPSLQGRAFALGSRRGGPPWQFGHDQCIRDREVEEALRAGLHDRNKRIGESGLPEYMREFKWEEMIPGGGRKEVVNKIREWAGPRSPSPGQICLHGAKGAGKTRLAATAAWERLQRHHVQWVSLPILIAKLGASFSDTGRAEAIKVLTGTGPLILDDVARDDIKVSDWAKVQIFTAIDARVQSGSPLLITTNIPPDRLEPILGGSTMSRIAGMQVLELPGRDNRLALPGLQAEQEAARSALREPEERD